MEDQILRDFDEDFVAQQERDNFLGASSINFESSQDVF